MKKRYNFIEARIKKGLYQRDVGKLVSISRSMVNSIELGTSNVGPEKQELLSKYLEVPKDVLFAIVEPIEKEADIKNKYEIRGEITAIFLTYKGNQMETIIDTADLPIVRKYPNKWFVRYDKTVNSYYVYGNDRTGGKIASVALHRWLYWNDLESKIQIDHINHDTLDNRRSFNLRKVDYRVNTQNRKGAQKNNLSSGIRGVSRKGNRWRARIQIDGKLIHLGYFTDPHEAEKVVKEARSKYMPYSQEALAN